MYIQIYFVSCTVCVYLRSIDTNFPSSIFFSQHGFAALMKDSEALTTMALSMFYGTHRYVGAWVGGCGQWSPYLPSYWRILSLITYENTSIPAHCYSSLIVHTVLVHVCTVQLFYVQFFLRVNWCIASCTVEPL